MGSGFFHLREENVLKFSDYVREEADQMFLWKRSMYKQYKKTQHRRRCVGLIST